MRNILKAMLVAVLIALALSSAYAGVMFGPKLQSMDTPVNMAPDAWFGGFDVLPNGNFVILDGHSLREIDLSGADIRTLFTYTTPVFGSFVKYNYANDRIYFGESSQGTIMSVSRNGEDASLLTTLTGNYDMDFWGDNGYVVAKSTIYRVNLSDGSIVAVATVGTTSGPVIFDKHGNMIYGTGNPNWPPTLNDQSIYRWSAVQVANAPVNGLLGAENATIIAADVDAPSGFAFDKTGTLVFTDSQVCPAVLTEVNKGSVRLAADTTPELFAWATVVRYNPTAKNVSTAVSWFDENWVSHTMISTLCKPGKMHKYSDLFPD